MHESKTFYFYIFFMKTRYFNTGFVSLQYKNTNQYWSKCSKIYEKITNFFLNFFLNLLFIYLFIFWLGPARPVWLGWTQQSYPGHWPNLVTRLTKACMRELFTHVVHSAKVIKMTSTQCYITTTDEMKKKKLPGVGRQSRRRWLDDYPGLTWGGFTGGAAGSCWLENGLDGGWPFFFFSSAFFFPSALFFSVSVFFFCFSWCCCRVFCDGSEGGAAGGCWPENGLDCGRPFFFFFFFSAFFSPALFSSISVFFFCFSRCCYRVCCGGGCWSVELLWEATVALLLSVQRREPVFFFSSFPPSLSHFFLFLTFPLYCFTFPSGPSPPHSPFFSLSAQSFFWLL